MEIYPAPEKAANKVSLPAEPSAIVCWRKLVLENDRMLQILIDLDIFAKKYTVVPSQCKIFEAFRTLRPCEVKVVMVAHEPYQGYCPSTGLPYACGLAFMPGQGCTTTPATLKNVVSELCRDLSKKITKSPRDMLFDWIRQGVLLLNSSLTLGKGCPQYLEDHSVMWEEVMCDILIKIYHVCNPVFVLIGKHSWEFEMSIPSCRVIKVSHPLASNNTAAQQYGRIVNHLKLPRQQTKNVTSSKQSIPYLHSVGSSAVSKAVREDSGKVADWSGSAVFSSISNMMIENGDAPVIF